MSQLLEDDLDLEREAKRYLQSIPSLEDQVLAKCIRSFSYLKKRRLLNSDNFCLMAEDIVQRIVYESHLVFENEEAEINFFNLTLARLLAYAN